MNSTQNINTTIINEILNIMPKSNDIVEITPAMSLNYDLGLDSISLMSLFHNLEKSLKIPLAEMLRTQITEIQTINQLSAQIYQLVAVEELNND